MIFNQWIIQKPDFDQECVVVTGLKEKWLPISEQPSNRELRPIQKGYLVYL